jgi:hypothetical protein
VYDEISSLKQPLADCRFTFVRDDTPLGVVTTSVNPAKDFKLKGERSSNEMIVGFGSFRDRSNTVDQTSTEATELSAIQSQFKSDNSEGTGIEPSFAYSISDTLAIRTVAEMQQALRGGGNVTGYFNNIQNGDLDHLDQDTLQDLRKQDQEAEVIMDDEGKITDRTRAYNNFASIYDIVDNTSVQARAMFDEKFDSEVSVIAGNGRTVGEAQTIWDQFRYGYHNYTSVKNIWRAIYNLDPDDNEESDDLLFGLIRGKTDKFLQDFNLIGSGGRSKEFETLLVFRTLQANLIPSTSRSKSLWSENKEKLISTQIFNKNYISLIQEFDSLDTFFFLDPPYENTANEVGYAEGSDTFNFEELKKICDTIKGTFLLTINDSPNIRELFKDYFIKSINVRNAGFNGKTNLKRIREELIITNYEL